MSASEEPNPPKGTLHPVYTVTNIQNKVRVLDGVKVTYSSWVKLFKLHARGYKVLHHIDGTPSPAKTAADYNQWSEIDAIVLQWIYGSISDDLLVRVLEPDSTAQEAWEKIKNLFLNNKGSRAAALEHEFTNLTLRSMSSLDEYCQKLKDLADQLTDVENPVNEKRLVLQLVCGLPPEFDTAAAYINQTLPDWDTARSMLQLEQNRQQAREGQSATGLTPASAEANIASDQSSRPSSRSNRGPQFQQQQQQRGSNRRDRPNSGNQSQPRQPRQEGSSDSAGPYAAPPWWMMMPPPCPYPTQQGWAYPWYPPQKTNSQQQQNRRYPQRLSGSASPRNEPPQAHTTGTFNALEPTDIGNAFQAMTMHGTP